MSVKKILGIVLAVLFGGGFVIGEYTFLFYTLINRGYAVWFSALIGAMPFVGVALMVGIICLIFWLLKDSDKKSSERNKSGSNRNAKR